MTTASSPTLRRGLWVVGQGIRQQKRWFALAVVGSALYGVMTVGTSWAIGRVVRTIVTPAIAAHRVTSGQLWTAGLTLAVVVALQVVGVMGRRIAGGITMFNLGALYRGRVTRQYLRLPLSWHHQHPSGQLLSNANADVEATWNVFAPLPMGLGVLVMLVVGVVQMFLVDPVLAAVGLTVFPLLFAANLAFQRRMSPRVTLAQQLRAEVSEVAHESFEAALIVKSMGREDHEATRFAEVTHRLRRANVEVGRTKGTFDPVIEAIPTLGTLAVLAIGVAQVRAGELTAAEIVQVAYLFSILSFPVRAFGWILAELPRSVVGWNRVDAVLQAQGQMTYGDSTLPSTHAIEPGMQGASYSYGGSGSPAVRDVTLDVAAGSTTALVGPTGSGKSTLTSLLLRLVDPDTGTVLMDGVDLRQVRRGGVPEVASVVAQQTFLFDDTVRGNVAMGLDISDEEVWRALRLAQGEAFVRALPDGLDTRVGERGTSLSGGQRQRIALARAVARRPRLLVLDDATSAVDPSVEQAILAGLRRGEPAGPMGPAGPTGPTGPMGPSGRTGAPRTGAAGTTLLVVAYRMSTISIADEVVYLEHGRVVDQGSHDRLLSRCEGYARLVTAYAREAASREAASRAAAAEAADPDAPALVGAAAAGPGHPPAQLVRRSA